MFLCNTRHHPPFQIRLQALCKPGNVEPEERGLQHLEFAMPCVYICWTDSEETVSCSSLLWCLMIYRKCLRRACVYFFSLSLARTKLLCCEQRRLHSPLFSNPCRPLLQMSQQCSGCGLRGKRRRVLNEDGRALRVDTVQMFGRNIRSHSALLKCSCWKCHWIPEANMLGFLLLSVMLIYIFTFPTAFIKSQLPLRIVNINTIILSFPECT